MPAIGWSRGATPGSYELLPSTAEPWSWQPTTALVVGFERDEAGRAALLFATELGGRLAARVHVVHAVTLTDYPVDPDSPGWEEEGAKVLTAIREEVQRSLGSYPFGWTYRACRGDAAALADLAEQHDALLIVVGRHPSGFRELLRRSVAGSVSRRLPRRCGRPVVLVAPPAESESAPASPPWPEREELT